MAPIRKGIPLVPIPLITYMECDIAYLTEYSRVDDCRFLMRANTQLWEQMPNLRLASVGRRDGWLYPLYEGELSGSKLLQEVNSCLECKRDIIFDVFWLTTGQEEGYWPKDKHGFFDLREMVFQREQVLRQALASSIGSCFEKILVELGFPTPVPRWPSNMNAAACVGHDVDYPEVIKWIEPVRVIFREGVKGIPAALSILMGRRNHWNFESWIQMENSLNVRSAFYFVTRQGSLLEYLRGIPDPFYDVRSKQFKGLFSYLVDEGFEIGLHASYQAFESKEKFEAEKQILEESSGQRISGNRHHYWHMDSEDPESTLLIHEQIGMRYDSSLIHERYIGWRRGLSWPFFPFHQKERRELKTLQIPTAWMDDQLFGHKPDNPGDRHEILRALVDTTVEQGGCLLINIHDYVFDEVLFPGWTKTYQWLMEYVTSRSDFWIDTPGRIADHWIQRYTSILRASQGLTGKEDFFVRTIIFCPDFHLSNILEKNRFKMF